MKPRCTPEGRLLPGGGVRGGAVTPQIVAGGGVRVLQGGVRGLGSAAWCCRVPNGEYRQLFSCPGLVLTALYT